MSFSFPPATKFAPNSRNDAFLASRGARLRFRAERELGISSRLTYDLFKLCFYRCPLRLPIPQHTRRRRGPLAAPPCLLQFQPRRGARARASRGAAVKSTTISETSIGAVAPLRLRAAGRWVATKTRDFAQGKDKRYIRA